MSADCQIDLRQLALRYAGALSVAGVVLDGGFDVVVETVDSILSHLHASRIRRPFSR